VLWLLQVLAAGGLRWTVWDRGNSSCAATNCTVLIRIAGIGGGLVRMSVGLTGTVEQRWEQLQEAYRHVAQKPVTAMPQYKAVQVGLSARGIRELSELVGAGRRRIGRALTAAPWLPCPCDCAMLRLCR
jgi:hypothetical protein